MKIERSKLTKHLRRIACEGRINDAVFVGAFATTALTGDHMLLVVAPPLTQTGEVFTGKHGVGVADIGRLLRSLAALSGPEPDSTVEVRMEKTRLVVDESPRGVVRLLTVEPKTVGTRVEPALVESIVSQVPADTKGIPLTRALIEGVRATFSLLKVAEVELLVGPKGGLLRVGNDNSDVAEFSAPELVADTPYTLRFGPHLVDVFAVVTEYTNASLRLSGPDNAVVITDGDFAYYLSPRVQGA